MPCSTARRPACSIAPPFAALLLLSFPAAPAAAEVDLVRREALIGPMVEEGPSGRSLALGHLDRDGVPDLVVGRAGKAGAEIRVHRGLRENGETRWEAAAFRLEVPTVPDDLVVGDFDRDGLDDVALAGRGRSRIFVAPGRGDGTLGSPFPIPLGGTVDRLIAGPLDLPDGLDDLVVGLTGPAGPEVLLFVGNRSLLAAAPERLSLPDPVADASIADVGGDPAPDLVVATGGSLVVVEGRVPVFDGESRRVATLPVPARTLAVGRFLPGESEALDLAVRGPGGVVELLRLGDPGGDDPFDLRRRIGRAADDGPLFGARLGGGPLHRLVELVARPDAAGDGDAAARITLEDRPAAILTGRFDGDGLTDVLLLPRRGAPLLLGTRGTPSPPIVVDSNGDAPDASGGDGSCDTGTGECTFRAALQTSNTRPGPDEIHFDVDFSNFIAPIGSELPGIRDTVTIDATTSFLRFTIDGASADSGIVDGLHIRSGADGTVVRGLRIRSFSGAAIRVFDADDVVIAGCTIADNATSSKILGMAIHVDSGSGGTIIGGTAAGDGNRIVGHESGYGIFVGSAAQAGIFVQGNAIGLTNIDTANPNMAGISLWHPVTVGGADPGAGNVVSGNSANGIEAFGSQFLPVIQGNLVGLDADGEAAIPNGGHGVLFNGEFSVPILGGTGAGNTISGNAGQGLRMDGGSITSPLILGNRIGTDVTGTSAVPNGTLPGDVGVLFHGVEDVTFGPGNVVSGNVSDGILIQSDFSGVLIGNFVGTAADGTAALPNGGAGLRIEREGTGELSIGGSEEGEGNVVSGNAGAGIEVLTVFGTTEEDDLRIVENRIGFGADGSPLGNGGHGIDSGRDFLELVDNEIGHNGGHGLRATGVAGSVRLAGDTFHANGGLGIDFGGDDVPTPNGSRGATDLPPINYPVIDGVEIDGPFVAVTGSLSSTPSRDFLIRLYASGTCDPSGHGEAERPILAYTVQTDANGFASIDRETSFDLEPWEVVTATATLLESGVGVSTSELSACVGGGGIFADGFESGDTTAWSG